MITEQMDMITIATLASRGDLFSGALMSWFIGLSDMLRGRAGLQAHRAIAPVISAGHLDQTEVQAAEKLVRRVKHAPLANTQIQHASNDTSAKFSLPLAITGLLRAIGTRDIMSAIGVVKPRCEFEAGSSKIIPTTVLSALTGAAKEGVVFAGGRAT